MRRRRLRNHSTNGQQVNNAVRRMFRTSGPEAAVIGVIGVAITVLGVWLWQRHDPPSPDDLQAIEGRITEPTFRRTKYGGRNVRFRIEGSDRQFSYVDWYPNASLVADAIRDGERITVWVDRRDPSQTPEVWRLQAGDGFIVGYDALVEARRSNARIGLGLAVVFGILTVAAITAWVRGW